MSKNCVMFSLASIRDEVIKKSLVMEGKRKIRFEDYSDQINIKEIKNVLGHNALHIITNQDLEKKALTLKASKLDWGKYKKYALHNILSYLDNFYYLSLSTGCLFPLNEVVKLGNTKIRGTVAGIINHNFESSRRVEQIKFWKEFSKNSTLYFNWMCSTNKYILFTILNIDENAFYTTVQQYYESISSTFSLVFQNKVENALSLHDISSYVMLILYALFDESFIEGLDEQTLCRIIPDISNDNNENINQNNFNDFIKFNETIVSKTGFINPLGTLELIQCTRDIAENNHNDIDVYSLILASDIYYQQGNLDMARKCSLRAYERGNRSVAAYNLGYHSYIELLKMDGYKTNQTLESKQKESIHHLDLAFKYFSESALNGFPSAFTSLGNLCVLLSKNPSSSIYILDNMHMYDRLLKIALKTGFAEDKKLSKNDAKTVVENLNLLKHSFYEKSAELGNLDAMYSCIRDIEKRIPVDVRYTRNGTPCYTRLRDDIKEIVKWHEELVKYRHPKGVNSFCCYVMTDRGISDLLPAWYNSVSYDERHVILNLYNTALKNSNLPICDDISILSLLQDVCFYNQVQLHYFWPIYHFVYLYNEVKAKNIATYSISNNESSYYEFDTIIALLEDALRPNILAKELFSIKRQHEVEEMGYKLLYKILAQACKAGEDREKIEYHLNINQQKFNEYKPNFDMEDKKVINQYLDRLNISDVMEYVSELKTLIASVPEDINEINNQIKDIWTVVMKSTTK